MYSSAKYSLLVYNDIYFRITWYDITQFLNPCKCRKKVNNDIYFVIFSYAIRSVCIRQCLALATLSRSVNFISYDIIHYREDRM